ADMPLSDMEVDGETVPVLMQAAKNGFFYVLDRRNGKLISAENFVEVNWASGIDLSTGRPIENEKARFREQPYLVRPRQGGAHGPEAMSFNPGTQLAYIPARHTSSVYSNVGIDPLTWEMAPGMVMNT